MSLAGSLKGARYKRQRNPNSERRCDYCRRAYCYDTQALRVEYKCLHAKTKDRYAARVSADGICRHWRPGFPRTPK